MVTLGLDRPSELWGSRQERELVSRSVNAEQAAHGLTLVSSMTAHMMRVLRMALRRLSSVSCRAGRQHVVD